MTEFSERPSPKPPPVDESEPPSDESAESVELPSACLRPGSKPPPDESLNDESSSPILTTQRLSPIAKVSEPVAQRLSPTAKVFEPAEVPERSSSNVPSVGESSDRLSSELSKLRAATPIVDFPPLVSTSGLSEPIELGRPSYLERFKSSGRQASPTVSSRLPGKLLKEVKNGVVSSGITMEEEDSVPKSGLMPVKQYLIHQAKLSQSAPPVQPYRKSSSGLSQGSRESNSGYQGSPWCSSA